MREPWDVIVRPVVTEKSTDLMDRENVYAFVVDKAANKIDIARAVEQIWDVKVEHVRTMVYRGKMKRSFLGRMNRNWSLGRRPSFKKAVVKLAEGDHIELYEIG
jgi:large subunit ribosomal protein L23